ncbi:MAG: Hsp33 family molecular chaperone HslO, partial [Betaproteobacteria bacterium]
MTPHRSDSRGTDVLAPFVFEHARIRGSRVQLDRTSRSIVACHPYPASLARALAELLAASALLASSLKLHGSLAVQLSSDGPVRLLVVECGGDLVLRATAQWDDAQVAALPPDAPLAVLAGGSARGRLTLTLDSRDTGTLYQGIVALETTSVASSIEHYLATSEQLPSRLWLDAGADGAVHGLLLQRLPGNDEPDAATWERITGDADTRAAHSAAHHSPADALRALFPHDDVRMFDERAVTFACKCSLERVERALRIAGRDEIEAAIAERGIVDVTC